MSTPIAVAGQSLRVSAVLGVDLSGGSAVVKYKPPSTTAGSIAATIDDAASGAIHADIPAATLSAAGEWTLWASATLSSGDVVKTYAQPLRVVAEGVVVA